MASKVTKFLGNVVGGIFGGDGDMRDHQHAARLFTDNFMALAPKVEFLYHVYFDINEVAARSPGNFGFAKAEPNIEVGMLVKQCNVPGVNVTTETKNQYGKKTNIQTQVQYTPVNITFHDDHTNLISGMWQQYFKNYYADSNFPDELGQQPTYSAYRNVGPGANKATTLSQYQFGYHSWVTANFFNRISIYQLSQHKFYEYTLINPIIQSWEGPQLSSASSNPAENRMTIIYEGIKYAEGSIKIGTPDGFAQLHYDTTPSPLSLMGGGTATLFGDTGVLAGGLDVFGDVMSGDAFLNPQNFIGTAIKTVNTVKNAKELSKNKGAIKSELLNIGTKAVTTTINNAIRIPASDKVNDIDATVTKAWTDGKIDLETKFSKDGTTNQFFTTTTFGTTSQGTFTGFAGSRTEGSTINKDGTTKNGGVV